MQRAKILEDSETLLNISGIFFGTVHFHLVIFDNNNIYAITITKHLLSPHVIPLPPPKKKILEVWKLHEIIKISYSINSLKKKRDIAKM